MSPKLFFLTVSRHSPSLKDGAGFAQALGTEATAIHTGGDARTLYRASPGGGASTAYRASKFSPKDYRLKA